MHFSAFFFCIQWFLRNSIWLLFMLTKYLQKLVEETDHFGKFRLRGKTYFCSFIYSTGLYSAGAYDNILGQQSKKTPNPRTEYRCLCNGKYQEPLQSPVCFQTLRLTPFSSSKPKSQWSQEGLHFQRRRTFVFHPGCGGGCSFQWLQLPLLVESQSQGSHQPGQRPATSQTPSPNFCYAFNNNGMKVNWL